MPQHMGAMLKTINAETAEHGAVLDAVECIHESTRTPRKPTYCFVFSCLGGCICRRKMRDVPHVVIIGGGFGGLDAARALDGAPVRVTSSIVTTTICSNHSGSAKAGHYVPGPDVLAGHCERLAGPPGVHPDLYLGARANVSEATCRAPFLSHECSLTGTDI